MIRRKKSVDAFWKRKRKRREYKCSRRKISYRRSDNLRKR
jgi:hypothetical protein